MSGEMVAHIEAGVWKKIAYTVLDSVAPNFHLPQWGPIFAGFDAVAMPTKWSCDVVEQNFGLRPTYLPHMYDPNQFKPGDKRQARSRFGIDPEAFLILGVGVNRKRKMIPAWFETVAKFAAKAPQGSKILFWAHINSIPDDPGYDLKALADHYELERYGVQAVNTQRLPEAVYPEALKAADVVIHLTGGEGAGVVPMEAAACRIPSFVTAYTGQTEHVPDIADNFLKIPPKALIPQPGNVVMWAWPDTDIAAERMLEYFSNATLRTKIKRATFEHIQKFKSDVVLPKFEKWLEDTIAMQQTEHLTVEVV